MEAPRAKRVLRRRSRHVIPVHSISSKVAQPRLDAPPPAGEKQQDISDRNSDPTDSGFADFFIYEQIIRLSTSCGNDAC